MLSAVCICENL